jgi:D-inositol-3-phosphate glycosyltransferase
VSSKASASSAAVKRLPKTAEARSISKKRDPLDVIISETAAESSVALLTGGDDRSYALGLATALRSKGTLLDVIGSDVVDCPEFHDKSGLSFLNLRGDQRPDASLLRKVSRILLFYAKLVWYARGSKAEIFHILWNNKFQFLDRTLLMFYYKLLGKKIVLTAHNVNACRRDGNDTFLNRFTLRIQYQLAAHIFVHTEKMKQELMNDFGVEGSRITVIPLGINDAFPNTDLTANDARQRLNIRHGEKTILFFGRIAPYKGLEYLVGAFRRLSNRPDNYRLIIAGKRERGCEAYWSSMEEAIREDVRRRRILLRADFIPDDEAEIYFKAADVLVLPYKQIYQSGVLFLGYSFGLPALVADVGSLKDEIVEGQTGFVFRPEDPAALAETIERYFSSDLYWDLAERRLHIRDYATKRYCWDTVGEMTTNVYAGLLRGIDSNSNAPKAAPQREESVMKPAEDV